MVENYMKQSALAHLGLNARISVIDEDSQPGVTLAELTMTGQIGLRLDASNKKVRELAESALGFPLAIVANTTTSKGKQSTLWLGPDEWLVLCPADQCEKLIQALTKALNDHHAAVFDVSDSRVIISLSGPNARDVLKKGCGLDLHPRVFGPGQCAGSTLAMAHVLINQTANNKDTTGATYQLFVHRSFAPYLWAWLEDAAGEYGIRISAD